MSTNYLYKSQITGQINNVLIRFKFGPQFIIMAFCINNGVKLLILRVF